MSVDTTGPVAPGDRAYWMMGGHAEAGYRAVVLAAYPLEFRDHAGVVVDTIACDIRWYSRIAGEWRIARCIPRRRLFREPPAFTVKLAVERAPKPERMTAAERRTAREAAEERARAAVKRQLAGDAPDIRIDPTVKPKRSRKPAHASANAPVLAPAEIVAGLSAAELLSALTPAQLAALAELAKARDLYKPAPAVEEPVAGEDTGESPDEDTCGRCWT